MSTSSSLGNIPTLGVGVGYRRQFKNEVTVHRGRLDFLEITTEHFIQHPRQDEELEELSRNIPTIPHGLRLSLGSALPMGKDYLRAIKRVSDATRAPYYSDHLTLASAPGIDIGHLSPVWLTRESLENAVRNVSRVQDFLGKPLVLENITYYFELPGGHMSQAEFFHHLVERTGCGILLDLANLYTNATNHRFEPLALLGELPLERVVQIHLAGGTWSGTTLVDSHSERVQEPVWKLLEEVVARCNPRGIVIERDQNLPPFEELLDEVSRARDILGRGRAATARAV